MNSSEYHECMGEVCFTRALLWMFFAAAVFETVANPAGLVIGIINLLTAIGYLVCWRIELRRANE
ncbi:MAG: hypothetical protein IKG21_13020 [Atopobiaceae bacterium]|nr:hypothetical protein [Atopobiaceae bacterium]MBR3160116.1 hypothetical protein [Atopobiaceae bacterium]MBR3318732.1 hypothetical protein [Atopobiaceae bacterium]